jgi:O-methyltransferase
MFEKVISVFLPFAQKILPMKVQFFVGDLLGDTLHNAMLKRNKGSLIPKERLDFLVSLLEKMIQQNLNGDVIECGVYKGGSCRLMAKKLNDLASSKKIYALDTFDGFFFDDNDFKFSGFNECYPTGKASNVKGKLKVDFAALKKSFVDDGLDNVVFLKGFFEENFPKISDKKFCFAHVDADLYISIKQCVEFLKDKMVKGGIIFFDDYNSPRWPGAAKAVNELLDETSIIKLDGYQAYWINK